MRDRSGLPLARSQILTLSHTEAVLGLLHSLVFEKPPTPPYETTSIPFQIETARIHAIDQSISSFKIFPLGRT